MIWKSLEGALTVIAVSKPVLAVLFLAQLSAGQSWLSPVPLSPNRCMMDSDDEVRDRATFYLNVLQQRQLALNAAYIFNGQWGKGNHSELLIHMVFSGLSTSLQSACGESGGFSKIWEGEMEPGVWAGLFSLILPSLGVNFLIFAPSFPIHNEDEGGV